MQRIKGWTKNEFIGCDICKAEAKFICQAQSYTISKIKGKSEWETIRYCSYHADRKDPVAKRLERQKKKEIEQARKKIVASDERERDWYAVSGVRKYL